MRLALAASLLTLLVAPVAHAAEPAKPRPTVAVLYFDYDGTDEEITVLRKGLAQMLIVDLAQNKAVRVVEREKLQEVLDELNLGRSNRFDQASVAKVGKLLGAQYLVAGSILVTMNQFHLTARAIRVETRDVPLTFKTSGKPENFLDLEGEIAEAMAKGLAKLVPAEPTPASSSSKPAEARPAPKRPTKLAAQTAVKYARALDALDRKDPAAARKDLEAVIREQPDFALASAELANLVR